MSELIAFFIGWFAMMFLWYKTEYKVYTAVYHRGYRKGRADAPMMKWTPTYSRPPFKDELTEEMVHMSLVYEELHGDGDNCRANRIIDAGDEYAESMAYNMGLTVSRAYAVAEFIDMNIFSAIRNDDDFDSFQCLRNLCKAYEKLCEISGFVGLTDAERPPKEPEGE